MSFRSKSSQLATLIALSAVLLLGGCTMLSKDGAVKPAQKKQQSLYGWRDIDGGFEGSGITGKRHVRFLRPVQVAARGNFVFIVDAGADLLYRYELARDQLTVVMDLNHVTAGEVSDIYLYPDHSFLLVDPDSARVLHFDRNGRYIRTFEDRLNLIRPVAVTYDEAMGRVLIADGSSDDILVFTTTGQLQGVIGARGVTEGRFLNITAITSGEDGIYATARLGHRVQLMGRDGSHLKTFQPDTVVFPLAIAVDRSHNTFVSDYLDNSIKVFRDGLFLESIAGSGAGPGRFKRISDLWYDAGFLYAVDSLNGRIQILRVEVVEPILPIENEDEAFEAEATAAAIAEEMSAEDDVPDGAAAAPTSTSVEAKSVAQQELEAAQSELEKIQSELAAARAELEAAQAKNASEADKRAPSDVDEADASQVNGSSASDTAISDTPE